MPSFGVWMKAKLFQTLTQYTGMESCPRRRMPSRRAQITISTRPMSRTTPLTASMPPGRMWCRAGTPSAEARRSHGSAAESRNEGLVGPGGEVQQHEGIPEALRQPQGAGGQFPAPVLMPGNGQHHSGMTAAARVRLAGQIRFPGVRIGQRLAQVVHALPQPGHAFQAQGGRDVFHAHGTHSGFAVWRAAVSPRVCLRHIKERASPNFLYQFVIP